MIPYFGYARQDRKDQPRVSITAKLVANLITTAGADRVITMDLHSPQIQGFFDIPMDHLYASTVLMRALWEEHLENVAVVAPDVGSARLARSYAKRLDAELVLVDKRRPQHNVAEILHVIGDVAGKDAVIVDDIIDTAGTLVHCAEALVRAGARRVIGACTHAVLSGNAIERIEQSDAIAYVYVTDTIPLRRSSPKLRVISVAQLFAEAILRTHQNTSISSLFEIVR